MFDDLPPLPCFADVARGEGFDLLTYRKGRYPHIALTTVAWRMKAAP